MAAAIAKPVWRNARSRSAAGTDGVIGVSVISFICPPSAWVDWIATLSAESAQQAWACEPMLRSDGPWRLPDLQPERVLPPALARQAWRPEPAPPRVWQPEQSSFAAL